MPSFYALITTIDVPSSPPGWDTFPRPTPTPPGYPSHPVYYPPYPSQGLPPYPDQGLPGGSGGQPSHPIYYPPYPSQGPGFPTHPIAPGGQPPYPSQGPGFPTHPIVLPPPPGSGAPPIAANLPVFPPEATHPIQLPPNVAPPTTPDGRRIEWKTGWSQMTGWVIYGVPTGAVPTPSAAQPTSNPQAPRPA